jgi:Caspase domain
MTLTRREFIERAGWSWLALGVGLPAFRPASVLAAPIPHKFAVLVGIDRYGSDHLDLKGCTTDVELQRLLLQYRFGFLAENILVLTGEHATRLAIETAFQEHLIAQAQPDDLVIFHFSGRGARIEGQDCLIPSDGAERAISLDTLLLLAACLPTGRSTLVLDTSFAPVDRPRLGNLRSRSYADPPATFNLDESAFQEAIKQRYKPKNPVFQGILLTASNGDQTALELSGNGWNAGLFTYALTSYLWSDWASIARQGVGETVESILGTGLEPKIFRQGKSFFAYNTSTEKSRGGAAIVTNLIDVRTIELTLTGLPLEVLENYGSNSRFTSPGTDGEESTVAIAARQGLTAKAKILTPDISLAIGQVLQEKLRVFPAKIGLIVALDSNLSRIERVEAIGAFASLPDVTAVVNVGERRVDCLLSRVGTDELASYHLLSPNGSLILGSLGAENEAVKTGVKRLKPLLETLLALKFWRLLVNKASSRVAVSVDLENATDTRLSSRVSRPVSIDTCFTGDCPQAGLAKTASIARLEIGTKIRYSIENRENTALYGIILGVDADRRPLLLCSCLATQELTPFVVAAGSSSIVLWKVTAPVGLVENYVILSRQPFEKTFVVLKNTQTLAPPPEQFLILTEPLDVARALWEDMRVAPEVKSDSSSNQVEEYAFDVGTWTAMGFLYRVIPGTR